VRDCAAAHGVVMSDGWLSRMPGDFQRGVLTRCRLKGFRRGEHIYSVGDPPGGIFGLVAGGVAISVAPRERAPYIGHLARPGSWFGIASAVTGQPRQVGLAATRTSWLLHLPLNAVHEIVSLDPTAWRLFAIVMLGHLELAIGACDDLMLRDPVKRCIATLLRLGNRQVSSEPASSPVEIDLSQNDIAILANVSRTTLNETLAKLEEAGAVERSYRCLRILAPGSMRALLGD
jgi:CRP/FNR family cyclic AMP-dependent transcriptional regulator